MNSANTVVTKIVYIMHIMYPEELKKYDYQLYYQYYGFILEMIHEPVSLKVVRLEHLPVHITDKGSNDLFRLGAKVDDAIGAPLGIAEMLTNNKAMGRTGAALTGLSIMHDLDRGEYWSAGGKVLLFTASTISSKVNVYAGIINFGVWMYNTDRMQNELARGFANEYKSIVREINRLDQATPPKKRDSKYNRKRDKLVYKLGVCERNFINCVNKLGYEVTDRK